MPDRCSIPECRAISNRNFGKLSMFRLPKDDTLRAKWLKSIGKNDWNPSERAVICERHFEPSAILKNPQWEEKGRCWKSRIITGNLPTILVPADTAGLPVPVARKKRRGKKQKMIEVRRKRGRRRRTVEELDSMPLQQRLTSISSASKEQEKPVQTLKSQPLSPTKLKVTRQSTSKVQQKQEEEEAPQPVSEEICLKWNTHHSNMQTAFPALLNKEQYCDVTLVAEGRSLKCHKLILSSCSSYFDEVLEKVVPYQHPIIFMKDIPFNIMKALCDFMYVGEVNIVHSDLDQILSVGNSLKIKGLAKTRETAEDNGGSAEPEKNNTGQEVANNDTVDDTEITDPLDLMEPIYEESATPDIPPAPKRGDQTRKSTGRRIRKRKHVEVDHEPSPPVFRMRKGTRSRPNVRVPRYFNANFDNSAPPPPAPEPEEYNEPPHPEESYLDSSYMNILEHIKTEPLDIEDGLISYENETFNHELPEETVPVQLEEEIPKVAKRRKLTKTEQEKPDPLKLDNVVKRRKRRGRKPYKHLKKSQALENSVEATSLPEVENGGNIENNDTVRLENSDRPQVPLENSDGTEIPMEDSDEELRGFEKVERPVNSNLAVLENSDITVLENSDQQPISNETVEENEDIGSNILGGDVENSELQSEEAGYHEIRIEKSYTDETDEERFQGFATEESNVAEEDAERPLAVENSDAATSKEDEEAKIDEESESNAPEEEEEEILLSLSNEDENNEEPFASLPETNEAVCNEEIKVNTLENVVEDVNEAGKMEETNLEALESRESNIDETNESSGVLQEGSMEFLTNSQEKEGAC